jgi:hypothetical protein
MTSAYHGGDVRVRGICEWLRQNGHRVTLAGREEANAREVKETKEWARKHSITLVCCGNTELSYLQQMDLSKFDVAILTVWFWRSVSSVPAVLMPLLKRKYPKTTIVLQSDDLHYHRCEQEPGCPLVAAKKAAEAALYNSGHLVISNSQEDAASFRVLAPQSRVVVLPMTLHLVSATQWAARPAGEGLNLLYVGGLHAANIMAVQRVLEWFPALVTAFPGVRLTLAGNDHWTTMLAQSNMPHKEQVTSVGTVDSLEPYFNRKTVVLAPVVLGGTGISTKVLMALENMLPVITTRHGLNGIVVECPQLLYRGETVEQVVELVRKIEKRHFNYLDNAFCLKKQTPDSWNDIAEWTNLF